MKNPLNQFKYNENSYMISCTQQIVDATDRNTEAIKENTAAIEAQTTQQATDAKDLRDKLGSLFSDLIGAIARLFSKNDETYYDLIQRESDETQAAISANTNMVQTENNETQAAISANTNMIQSESNETQKAIEEVKTSVVADTNADSSNTAKIVNAIGSLIRGN